MSKEEIIEIIKKDIRCTEASMDECSTYDNCENCPYDISGNERIKALHEVLTIMGENKSVADDNVIADD